MCAVKFSVNLLPANTGFVNYSELKLPPPPTFRTLKQLSRGALWK